MHDNGVAIAIATVYRWQEIADGRWVEGRILFSLVDAMNTYGRE